MDGADSRSLAGYITAAALSAARNELPADAREAVIRLFALERKVNRLYDALQAHPAHEGQDLSEYRAQARAAWNALEQAAEEFINLSRKARGRRARRRTGPRTRQPATSPPEHPTPPADADRGHIEFQDWFEPG